MKIGSFNFNNRRDVCIYAEIGINHNGSMEIAKKLIDIAAECGCNGVKFQKRTPELCVPEEQKNILRETPWGLITYLEYRFKVEFSTKQMGELAQYTKDKKIDWFVSCWDEQSLDEMIALDPVAIKLPSPLLTNEKMIRKLKSSGLPAIWSTGMSTLNEVDHAYKLFSDIPNIMCHCNSTYPAKYEELNLNFIKVLLQNYKKSIIGYSGHEVGLIPTIVAAVLGARYVERHITLDRALWGTDQAASVEPQGLKRLVRDIRDLNLIMGNGEKVVYDSELAVRKKLRKLI